MKPIWTLLAILACFGIAGRIDYEVAADMAATPIKTAQMECGK
jgi:hypothetical protein